MPTKSILCDIKLSAGVIERSMYENVLVDSKQNCLVIHMVASLGGLPVSARVMSWQSISVCI